MTNAPLPPPHTHHSCVPWHTAPCRAQQVHLQRLHLRSQPSSPAQRLHQAVMHLLLTGPGSGSGSCQDGADRIRIQGELLADLPCRWERLGDLALLPPDSLQHPAWAQAVRGGRPALLQAVAVALGVSRLAQQRPVANTGVWGGGAGGASMGAGWVSLRFLRLRSPEVMVIGPRPWCLGCANPWVPRASRLRFPEGQQGGKGGGHNKGGKYGGATRGQGGQGGRVQYGSVGWGVRSGNE